MDFNNLIYRVNMSKCIGVDSAIDRMIDRMLEEKLEFAFSDGRLTAMTAKDVLKQIFESRSAAREEFARMVRDAMSKDTSVPHHDMLQGNAARVCAWAVANSLRTSEEKTK